LEFSIFLNISQKKIPDFEYLLKEMSSLSNIEKHLEEQVYSYPCNLNIEQKNPDSACEEATR
jgi:hypothetical protein